MRCFQYLIINHNVFILVCPYIHYDITCSKHNVVVILHLKYILKEMQYQTDFFIINCNKIESWLFNIFLRLTHRNVNSYQVDYDVKQHLY